MPRVLVSDPIADAGIEKLRSAAEVDVRLGLAPDELIRAIPDYDALAVRSETKVTAEVIREASRLRVIGRAGVGVDNIDVKAATERGILVVNSPEGNTLAAAELTVAMMLSLARNIPQADASLRAGKWERKKFLGAEVFGKTLGIIGLGKIGGEVARRARGFEMQVIAYDPFATAERAGEYGAELVSLDEIYRRSDFISLHVPINDQTRGMIAAEQLDRMRDGVRIINCARGGLVDETALAAAIESGKVAGAGFDVFSNEPPEPGNPLLGLPQMVVTPHLGASTEEAQVNVALDIAEQIIDVLNGRPARAAVNMPSLSAEALAHAQPWLLLGEKIGSLHTQLARDPDGAGQPIESVEVLFAGEAEGIPTGAVTRAVLAGLLTQMLSRPANLVNAPVLAAQRGMKVTESTSASSAEFHAMLSVTCQMPNRRRTICGATFGKKDVRIVHIDGYHVDIVPEGLMVLTQHEDKPGIIGSVGTLLGSNGINIAGMNVGRATLGGEAIMVLTVDDPISPDLMARIRAIPGMERAQLVSL